MSATDAEVEAACKAFGSPLHTRSEADLRTDMRAALEQLADERDAICELYRTALLMFSSLLTAAGADSDAGNESAAKVRAWAAAGVIDPNLFEMIHEHSRTALLDALGMRATPDEPVDVEKN